jgi:thioredoxin 1
MEKKKLLRIAVPLVIVLVLAGLWSFKNLDGKTPAGEGAPDPLEGLELSETEKTDFALDAAGFDLEQLKSYGLPIVLDFGADWCGPCRSFKPTLEAIHAEMLGKAIIKYVDVDEYAALTGNFPVTVIPTQVFIAPDGAPYDPAEDLGVEFKRYADRESGEVVFTAHEGALTETQFRGILADMGVKE